MAPIIVGAEYSDARCGIPFSGTDHAIMISQAVQTSPAPSSQRLGTSFILLALFAGLLGGALALPFLQVHPANGQAFCHGILMTFFVMCPAALGGFGQWLLPSALGTSRTVLPGLTMVGFCFVSAGVVLLPIIPFVALLAWAAGILAVATDVITTCIEGRTCRFREMSPFAWSLLATACGALLVAPVLAAVVTRGFVSDLSREALIRTLHLPEMALMLTPALGLVCSALMPLQGAVGRSGKVAPYVFGMIGLGGPLLWVDGLFGGVPKFVAASLVLVTQILPSALLMVAMCSDVWRQRRDLDGAAVWAIGSVMLFAAGWLAAFFPNMGGDHTAAAFGGVMALSGGFYAWVETQLPGRVPSAMCRTHAGVTLAGALLSLTHAFTFYGEALMGVSLVAFAYPAFLLLRVAAQVRPAMPASTRSVL